MEGLSVGTSIDCDSADVNVIYPEAKLRHNLLGCHFIHLLKFMYKLNITYVFMDLEQSDGDYMGTLLKNGTIDIYARPVALGSPVLRYAYPIQAVFMWRAGFILRRERKQRMLVRFYRKPFHRLVWFSLIAMTFLAAVIFYILSIWERHLGSNGECSFMFELLLAIGGFCQHIFPVETTTLPRRTAYFVFFLFTYVIYTFYTSNLLSHLVSDKEDDMDLDDLALSGYDYMLLDDIKEYKSKLSRENTSILNQMNDIPVVNLSTGLEAVRTKQTALLSDFVMVYQEITKTFSNKEICDIVEIDLFSRIRKYLVTSKEFRYKQQIKISTLRMQEAGIIQKLTAANVLDPLECSLVVEVTTTFEEISGLLAVLIGCYIFTGLMVVCERVHFARNRLWPYVE
ncbi:ionotropic receptor 75a-like [Amyelois transitella]|uniref:ionotropic receptor 75a-like n=1 Tax=Amyelois transitella TaxID=680683 RepID=UPI002990803F|nr:ionotropic receptor 75a-like [Amyelois transitella]